MVIPKKLVAIYFRLLYSKLYPKLYPKLRLGLPELTVIGPLYTFIMLIILFIFVSSVLCMYAFYNAYDGNLFMQKLYVGFREQLCIFYFVICLKPILLPETGHIFYWGVSNLILRFA